MNKIVSLALTLLFVVGCADDRGSPVDVSNTQVVVDTDPRNVDIPSTPP